ncbi:hypothetical protein B4U79_17232 [Dinothrombium tinctorium]|uniref:F-box domain-containing protein n=1 Tax=Dinothrombium tinctorium TaxID=1965070 RepID=A0A3S4REV8_9ACAR|nr:hypothetical protein B4U79_17232 [Dinothrombium tinctorium]
MVLNILSLNDDELKLIFAHFVIEDLLKVRHVCRRFRYLAEDELEKKRCLTITQSTKTTVKQLALLPHLCPRITSINAICIYFQPWKWYRLLNAGFLNLTELSLNECCNIFHEIEMIGDSMSHIRVLKLSFMRIKELALHKMLKKLTNLKKLELWYVDIKGWGLHTLRHCVSSLILCNCKLEIESFENFMKYNGKYLKQLDFRDDIHESGRGQRLFDCIINSSFNLDQLTLDLDHSCLDVTHLTSLCRLKTLNVRASTLEFTMRNSNRTKKMFKLKCVRFKLNTLEDKHFLSLIKRMPNVEELTVIFKESINLPKTSEEICSLSSLKQLTFLSEESKINSQNLVYMLNHSGSINHYRFSTITQAEFVNIFNATLKKLKKTPLFPIEIECRLKEKVQLRPDVKFPRNLKIRFVQRWETDSWYVY